MQDKDLALKVSGVIFFLVGFMHLVRFFTQASITVGTIRVPVRASLFGFVVAMFLAIWMFKVSKAGK